MSTAEKRNLVPVEDYLAGELESRAKHEYLGGVIYAISGASNAHSTIAGNVFATFHGRLRGRSCRPFNSDTKIRIRSPWQTRFYYPDASVVCRPNPPHESFQDEPAVVVQVLSQRTRRTDEGEKKDAYLAIPSLVVYLLVEQDAAMVVAHRRGDNGFVREVYQGLEAVIPLTEIDAELPLAEIYETVAFTPEPPDED